MLLVCWSYKSNVSDLAFVLWFPRPLLRSVILHFSFFLIQIFKTVHFKVLLSHTFWLYFYYLLAHGLFRNMLFNCQINIYTMEYYSAIIKNTFESVLMRWMKLEPIIQSEVSQKGKDHYNILTHIYGIYNPSF